MAARTIALGRGPKGADGPPGPAGVGVISLNHDETAEDVLEDTPVGTRGLQRPAP